MGQRQRGDASVTQEHERLWMLIQNHPGCSFPAPRADLLASMRAIFNVKDRGLRLLKEELLEKYHLPVGSNLHGYFKMVTPQDFEDSRHHLQEKVNDLHHKIKLHWIVQEQLNGAILELPMNLGGNNGRRTQAESKS